MWLMRTLACDFKTVADFWKDNKEAVNKVHGRFALLCSRFGLLGGEVVPVDGSKSGVVGSKEDFKNGKVRRNQKIWEDRDLDFRFSEER